MVRARPDRRRQALRRQRRSGRADGAHQEHPVPGDRRARQEGPVADGPGLRRRASSCPYTTFGAKIQGGLKNYINGMIMVGATSPSDTARAETQITNLLRDRHHISRRRRRLLHPQPDRDGQRAAGGHQDDDDAARRHRRRLAARRRHRHHEHHAGVASPSARARSGCAWRSAPSRATSWCSSSSRR